MNTTDKERDASSTSPLEQVTHEQILARLRTATQLAETDFPNRLDALRETLTDLVDLLTSLEVVRTIGQDAARRPHTALLRRSVLTAAEGEPSSEFLLIPFGEVTVERPYAGGDFVFTREHAEAAQAWFESLGRKLAIDYEHQSFDRFNTRADGLRPAAGWIGGLEIRDDGLWAVDVTWTDRARELLRLGEYRYFSPVIFWTDEEHTSVAALGPVALTNDPAMRGVSPLAATRKLDEREPDDDECDLQASVLDPAGDPPGGDVISRRELDEAEAQIALLERQLAAQEADAFVERGMRLGKILDSTSMDWRADYLRDREQAEERLGRAPVLLPPGRMLTLNHRGEIQPLSESERQFRQHGEMYRRWGIGPEDLAAYEQAAAAGRVVLGGVSR